MNGMSQAKLAARAKITPVYLSRLLAAKQCNPSLDVAHRLAKALNVGVDELMK